MDDLISRQSAIKATWQDTGYTDPFNVMTAIRDRIQQLPPANTSEIPNSSDTISRQAAIDALCNDYCGGHQDCKYYPNCENLRSVQKLPSAQPAEPKRGRWIRTGSGSLYDHYECSECGKAPKWECLGDNRWKIAFTDFCPNCGCRMDGGEQ